MFKQAFRSYLASLHPKNYKKIKNSGLGPIWWFYWFIINPTLSDFADGEDWVFTALFMLAIVTPYFIMWWSNLGHKLSMPKMMYLLPMETEGRKEYLNTLLAIKIGFPALVGVMLHVILGMIYEMNWLSILLIAFAIFSFGVGMYVCSELRSKFDRYIRYGVRGKDGTGKDAILNWICMIYSVIYLVFATGVDVEETMGWIDWIWIIVPFSIMVIMHIAIIKTRYEAAITDVCNYEEAFNVLGKVKK